jgi:ribonuclease J
MFANGELAVATGMPRERVLLAEDGVVVDLRDGVAQIVGAVPTGYVYVDGASVGGMDEALLKDRRILRDEGFITCIVVIDAATGKIAAGPEITARGFAEDAEIFEQVIPRVEAAVIEATANGVTDEGQLQQVVRRAVGSWVGGKIRRRPMIIPIVIEA